MTEPETNRIVFTRHALDMLAERLIEHDWVEQTILRPEQIEADPARPNVVRAFRKIPERGGRILRVVFVRSAESIRVVTAFFDRKRRLP